MKVLSEISHISMQNALNGFQVEYCEIFLQKIKTVLLYCQEKEPCIVIFSTFLQLVYNLLQWNYSSTPAVTS